MRIRTSIMRLLCAIAAGREHRLSQDTYDSAVKQGLAYFDDGWKLTAAGRALVNQIGAAK